MIDPEFFETTNAAGETKRYRMWQPSDQDPRGAAYIPVNELFVNDCPLCMRGGMAVNPQ